MVMRKQFSVKGIKPKEQKIAKRFMEKIKRRARLMENWSYIKGSNEQCECGCGKEVPVTKNRKGEIVDTTHRLFATKECRKRYRMNPRKYRQRDENNIS